jgi:quinol monooxygenase YgiN
MEIGRREMLAGAAVLAGGVAQPVRAQAGTMYGLVGKMTANPGQRAALAAVLLEGVSGMPGCLSYVVANDPVNADLLWITEVWESRDAHRASLALPAVRAAIAKGRPLIAGMESVAETQPLGGHGLAR